MEINSVNRIIKWGNEVNLDEDTVRCQKCGKYVSVNHAIFKDDGSIYCEKCDLYVYDAERDGGK